MEVQVQALFLVQVVGATVDGAIVGEESGEGVVDVSTSDVYDITSGHRI